MSDWRPLEEREYPDPDDDDEDEDEDGFDSLTCPECGLENYEDAAACGSCGYYFVDGDRRPSRAAPFGWIGVMVVMLLLVALTGIVFLM